MTKPSDKSALEAAELWVLRNSKQLDTGPEEKAFLAGMEEQRARDAEEIQKLKNALMEIPCKCDNAGFCKRCVAVTGLKNADGTFVEDKP